MNQQKKNLWIQNVLNSGKSVTDSDVNPFLFSKIMNKVQRKDFLHQPVRASLSWSMLATVLLLILINVTYFSFQNTDTTVTNSQTASITEEVYDELAAEYLDQEDNDYAILTNY